MNKRLRHVLGAAVLVLASTGHAQDVVLEGVLGTKAVVTIDGARHVMGAGQVVAGVRLDSIESDHIFVTIASEQLRIAMGSHVTRSYSARRIMTARVYQDPSGMYLALGSINGFPVHMLLDTGATFVALNSRYAKRLGVEYRNGSRETVHTASGVVSAFRIKLDSVAVGEISIANVDAFVLEGQGPDIPLLGMSFLRQLRVSTENGVMLLEQNP